MKEALVVGIYLRVVTMAEVIAVHPTFTYDELNKLLENYALYGRAGLRVTAPGLRRAS